MEFEMTIQKTLSDIQARLKAPKSQENKFGGYKYRSLEDIQEALKPLLSEHGASVRIEDDIVLVGDRHYVKATASLMLGGDVITATAFAREPLAKKGMDESQITGAASSYARKYAMNGLFAIDDTRDADATNDHGKGEPMRFADDKQAVQPPRPAATAERISVEQAQHINELLYSSGIIEAPDRLKKFGDRYLGGSSDMGKMFLSDYKSAVAALEKLSKKEA